MSLVSKMEVGYLSLLRVVVLFAASILLLVAILSGVSGLLNVTDIGHRPVSVKDVDQNDVIKAMEPAKVEKTNKENPVKNSEVNADDPYKKHYEKIYELMNAFVAQYSAGQESVSKEALTEYVSEAVNVYQDEDLREQYIEGLVRSFEKALKSEVVIKRVKLDSKVPEEPVNTESEIPEEYTEPVQRAFKESPIEVAVTIISSYSALFQAQVQAADAENNERNMEKAANSAKSMMQLYVAGGAFAAFLMVVFVSILIKIERNLRVISEKN